jgi:hypothetical protein
MLSNMSNLNWTWIPSKCLCLMPKFLKYGLFTFLTFTISTRRTKSPVQNTSSQDSLTTVVIWHRKFGTFTAIHFENCVNGYSVPLRQKSMGHNSNTMRQNNKQVVFYYFNHMNWYFSNHNHQNFNEYLYDYHVYITRREKSSTYS